VTPDIICAGKGLSSGAIPIGSMIAREGIADAFYGPEEDGIQFLHGHTFAGNPLSCAAGIAVIDEIIEKDLAGKARRLGKYLKERLDGLRKLGVIREIRGKGVLIGIELVRDTDSMAPFPELGKALQKTALKNGLVMRIDPGWFAVCPPLIAEEPDIDTLTGLITSSLNDAIRLVA
jgi:adenosylmethionine-8-amino-7-oxononanoate aminotransferase